ncbi:hypothetical protein [Clostridium senegalense]
MLVATQVVEISLDIDF